MSTQRKGSCLHYSVRLLKYPVLPSQYSHGQTSSDSTVDYNFHRSPCRPATFFIHITPFSGHSVPLTTGHAPRPIYLPRRVVTDGCGSALAVCLPAPASLPSPDRSSAVSPCRPPSDGRAPVERRSARQPTGRRRLAACPTEIAYPAGRNVREVPEGCRLSTTLPLSPPGSRAAQISFLASDVSDRCRWLARWLASSPTATPRSRARRPAPAKASVLVGAHETNKTYENSILMNTVTYLHITTFSHV